MTDLSRQAWLASLLTDAVGVCAMWHWAVMDDVAISVGLTLLTFVGLFTTWALYQAGRDAA